MLESPGASFGLGTSPQVWLFSDFDGYNQLRPIAYPRYLNILQQARLERIRQARLLHDGRHWRLFVFEGRSQFDFPETRAQGVVKRIFVPYNLCKLISLKSADLLFGDAPAVRVEDEIQQAKLSALADRTSLHSLLYQMAVEASVDGEVYIQATIRNGQVYLQRMDAADIFPVGPLQPDGQYQSYVQYNARNVGTEEKPDFRLLVTQYLPGRITRQVLQLDQKGYILPKVLTLDQWPQQDPQDGPLDPETRTGLDRPNVVYIPNLLVRDIPVSDYDGLVELQDSLNAKNTQLARVLARHSDPKLAAPATAADPEGNLRANSDVYFFRNKEEIPQYITWNAEVNAAIQDRTETRDALLTVAEMSPILLGIRNNGASTHNAFKGVRLEAVNSLTKAQRKAVIWKAAVRRLLTLAQDLENTIPGERYDRGPLGIEMKDGIPADEDAQATTIATLRGAGVLSVERAVEMQLTDPAAVQKELANLQAEKDAAMPSIFMGQSPNTEPGEEETPAEEASESPEQEDAEEATEPQDTPAEKAEDKAAGRQRMRLAK